MADKRIDRRYKRADRKIDRASARGPAAEARARKKYGYDYDAARAAGLGPDETGHWPSRDPMTGKILKGRRHPTIMLTKQAERELGYRIVRRNGEMFSYPKKSR